ncbi:DnaB-like helicase C-terminal domain-containing protein [Desulfovibrio caledoniensis]
MQNMAYRQALKGYNVLFVTLEDSKEACMFKQLALMSDIILLNLQSVHRERKQEQLESGMPKLKKQLANMGQLWIVDRSEREFRVSDLRAIILEVGAENIDVVYVDYIGKIMPPIGMRTTTMYEGPKEVAASLRRLAMETAIPTVTAAQINRGGMNKKLDELGMDSVSESIAIMHSTDVAIILANYEDQERTYLNERRYKIVKNRIAGKHGLGGSFYWDLGTLKIFDESELDKWLKYARITGDNRDVLQPDNAEDQGTTKGTTVEGTVTIETINKELQ